jgi:hypothetical protein
MSTQRNLSDIVGHLFPTTIGGSYPRPAWNHNVLGDRDIRAALREPTSARPTSTARER